MAHKHNVKSVVWNEAKPQLSQGAIVSMADGHLPVPPPILQVLGVRKMAITTPGSPERYRLMLSDGIYHTPCILASQLLYLITQGKLVDRCVVKVTSFCKSPLPPGGKLGTNLSVITGLEMLASEAPKIGEPVALAGHGGDDSSAAPSAAPAKPAATAATAAPASLASPVRKPAAAAPTSGSPAGGSRRNMPPAQVDTQRVNPIRSLTLWGPSNWTIKAKVLSKSDLRTYNGAKGPGKVFNVDVQDLDGDQIKITGFNEAAEKFHPIFEQGKAYYISGGSVRTANKRFSKPNNDFEIHLEPHSAVEECPPDAVASFPAVAFNFRPISELQAMEKDAIVDVIGIVTEVQEPVSVNTKNGLTTKRNLVLADQSLNTITLSLWGKVADSFDGSNIQGQVLAVRAAKLSDYAGRSLSNVSTSAIEPNPEHESTTRLRHWWDTEGATVQQQLVPLSIAFGSRRGDGAAGGAAGGMGGRAEPLPEYHFGDVTLESLKDDDGKGPKLAYRNRAMVSFIKHGKEAPFYYNACAKCNRKVVQNPSTNQWTCENCQTTSDTREYRYMITALLLDHTGSCWVNFFNDHALEMMNKKTAQELVESNDQAAIDRAFNEAQFKTYEFKLVAKRDEYQGKTRVKTSCVGIAPTFLEEAQKSLVQKIAAYGITVPTDDGQWVVDQSTLP